ncbi:hypothetical protein [Geobacter sp. FeAm09]|nr:hypothetical protein [Geobacter sp. FeAm09]
MTRGDEKNGHNEEAVNNPDSLPDHSYTMVNRDHEGRCMSVVPRKRP